LSWLDSVRKAIGGVAHSAAVGAEVIKLQAALANLEEERERQYAEAGKRARELHRAHLVLDEELGVILKRVNEIEAQMEELRGEVQRLRASTTSSGTGSVPSEESGSGKQEKT